MPKRICFVTGTRAEFGLMRSTLEAIKSHRGLRLQIVATGMHLDGSRGNTLKAIRAEGWNVDAVVPWKSSDSPALLAAATGQAMAELAGVLNRLKSDVVLVVGDRVEAFAAAAAAAISGRVIAHVHGGDRAQGQVDDLLRHTITKMSHVHFPATRKAHRIRKLGEPSNRIYCVGSPGIDGIVKAAADDVAEFTRGLKSRRYALVLLHPVDANEKVEERRANILLRATLKAGVDGAVIIYPNTDPGAAGIVRAWSRALSDKRFVVHANVGRPVYLGLLRDAAVLVGNSSSGIIEAASFGTPVVDVGPRQLGRECARDVNHTTYDEEAIRRAVATIWNKGHPRRARCRNPYQLAANADSGHEIADILGRLVIERSLLRKLISY